MEIEANVIDKECLVDYYGEFYHPIYWELSQTISDWRTLSTGQYNPI
jgi:hypothetical protein